MHITFQFSIELLFIFSMSLENSHVNFCCFPRASSTLPQMQVTEHPRVVDLSGPNVDLFNANGGGQLTFADYDDDEVEADVGGGEGQGLEGGEGSDPG